MRIAYKCVRFFAYVIEILIIYILEQTPNLIPSVYGVRPVILVPVAVMIALFEGHVVGAVFGFFIGLLLDVGATGGIGFYSIATTCLGFLAGNFAQKIIKFNLITSVAVAIAFIFAFYAVHFLVEFLFFGYADRFYALVNHYLTASLYTAVLSPLIYFFTKGVAVNINYED